ncbi:MAG: helix-turn-helix domain-containing protein [Clostridia bacterium]|nr:helix-turn-helix domain-containing protein [Clostridia bacterium]
MNKNNINTDKAVYTELLEEYPGFMDVETFCGILGISRKTAYRMLSKGEIKHLKLSGEYRISKPALIDYLVRAS